MDLFRRKKAMVSLELTDDEVVLAQGKWIDKPEIQALARRPLPKGSYYNGRIINKEVLKREIIGILNQEKISTSDVSIVVSSWDIITREVTIPKVSLEEIRGIIDFQMEDLLPVDRVDYQVDYLILGEAYEDGMEKLSLLLIAVPKSIVEEHLSLVKDLELDPLALDFQANALKKLISKAEVLGDMDLANKTLGYIDLKLNSINVNIITDKNLELTRTMSKGVTEIINNISSIMEISSQEAEDAIDSFLKGEMEGRLDQDRISNIISSSLDLILEEIDVIFRYFRSRKGDNDVEALVLHGKYSKIAYFENAFSEYFSLPVVFLDRLDSLEVEKDLRPYANALGGLIRLGGV